MCEEIVKLVIKNGESVAIEAEKIVVRTDRERETVICCSEIVSMPPSDMNCSGKIDVEFDGNTYSGNLLTLKKRGARLFLFLVRSGEICYEGPRKKILIDTDGGIDDAIAIMVALSDPAVEVVGITTGYGNTSMLQASSNVLSILKLFGKDYTVPVAMGATTPLDGIMRSPDVAVHGANGLGNVRLPKSVTIPVARKAEDFIVSTIKRNPGEITVVSLGRLTNLARAVKKCPEIAKLAKKLIVMGGTVMTPGNVSACSEANINGDSRAAKIVFEAGFPMLMVGLDVTTNVRLEGSKVRALADYQNEITRPRYELLSAMLPFYFSFYMKAEDAIDSCPVHDPLAMLCAIDESLVTFERIPITVIVSNDVTNGMTLADRRPHPTETHLVDVALNVDSRRAMLKLLSYFHA